MFGSSKNEISKSKGASIIPSASPHSLNSLVQGTIVEGTVKSESDIRVDGMIKGKLFCDAKVIIGPTGHVDGQIRCKNAFIEGKFEGNLEVTELLNIRESANISGEITTGKLIVQSGAIFNVTCNMGANAKQAAAPGARSGNSEKESVTDYDKVAKAKPAGV